MLIVKYERRDFFGCYQYTEDSKENYRKEDLKKAFLFLGKDYFATIQKEEIIYFWDSLADFENKVVTTRSFVNATNYTEEKKAFDKVKKECYATIQ